MNSAKVVTLTYSVIDIVHVMSFVSFGFETTLHAIYLYSIKTQENLTSFLEEVRFSRVRAEVNVHTARRSCREG